jgi:hypothetical protein
MSNGGQQDMEKIEVSSSSIGETSDIDLYSFHEQSAGRLVIDPECAPPFALLVGTNDPIREAKLEFGETFASRLKLSPDGTKVLWPQVWSK